MQETFIDFLVTKQSMLISLKPYLLQWSNYKKESYFVQDVVWCLDI